MSDNRFDFLEITSEQPAQPIEVSKIGTSENAVDKPFGSFKDAEGRPLAQVVVNDLRGYQAFIKQDDSEPSIINQKNRIIPRSNYFDLIEVIGERGVKAGQFNFPCGIAVDSSGTLYIADSYNHRIQRITQDGGVIVIGSRGANLGQFSSPLAVAVDVEDSFYVVEQGTHRIQKYNSDLKFERVIGGLGHGPGQLFNPMGLALSKTCELYVADTNNCRIQKFDRYGSLIGIFGNSRDEGALTTPQDVYVDDSDIVSVVDTFAHRINRYDANGRYIGKYGGPQSFANPSAVRFVEPLSIAVDPSGMIYVVDRGELLPDGQTSLGRLQVIDIKTAEPFLKVDKLPKRMGMFYKPSGIAITQPQTSGPYQYAVGDVYISDTMNHRILHFSWNSR